MPETKISSADTSNFQGTGTNYSVATAQTDGATGNGETIYCNTAWSEQLGKYKTIPELMAAIDAIANWTIGRGFKSNELTETALSRIRGFGKDTFNTILENLVRTYQIGGDSFAEIIRDDEGELLNIKPLPPETINIVANEKGIIIRYEQIGKNKKVTAEWQPDKILHLSRNRVADEIHGVSLVDAVTEIILMRNEAMADYKKLLHRNIFPVRVWHLDTDIPAEISAFKAKATLAKYQGEDIFIPKGAVETELSAVSGNATLNPLPWINLLNQYFFQATGVPQIIVGGSGEMTEATAKICYLAFEQTISEEQLYIEETILAQINLEIELEFPASLENELLSQDNKSESMQAATPEDTTAKPAEQGKQEGTQ